MTWKVKSCTIDVGFRKTIVLEHPEHGQQTWIATTKQQRVYIDSALPEDVRRRLDEVAWRYLDRVGAWSQRRAFPDAKPPRPMPVYRTPVKTAVPHPPPGVYIEAIDEWGGRWSDGVRREIVTTWTHAAG